MAKLSLPRRQAFQLRGSISAPPKGGTCVALETVTSTGQFRRQICRLLAIGQLAACGTGTESEPVSSRQVGDLIASPPRLCAGAALAASFVATGVNRAPTTTPVAFRPYYPSDGRNKHMVTFEKAMIAVNLGGLLLTGVDVGIAAKAVIIPDAVADSLSATYWDYNGPMRNALKDQSRAARNGLLLVVAGTVLQAIAIVAPFFARFPLRRSKVCTDAFLNERIAR